MLHHLRVDLRYAVANGVGQLGQGEEAPVAQLAEHEARDDADGGLDLGLVARAANARRQHDEAVVIGEILIRPVDARLVARRLGDAGFEIIGHSSLRHTAEKFECVDVRTNPVGERLAPARLGVGVARCAERRDEEGRLVYLARHRTDDRRGVPSPVDEQLVTRHVRLPHRRREAPSPFAVKLAEAGIAVAVDMRGAMLLPQDHQRHAATLEFFVHLRPVSRFVLGKLRNRRFFSLAELNDAVRDCVTKINAKVMKHLKQSRNDLFASLDRPALKRLPGERYQYAEWKRCTVAPDYHVEVDDHYYSVPFGLLRETVEARFTDGTIEVFHKGQRIARHMRSRVAHKHTTIPEHMPSSHRRYAEWSPARMLREAEKIGPATIALFEAIMKAKPHPEQGFRSCLGILSLVKSY